MLLVLYEFSHLRKGLCLKAISKIWKNIADIAGVGSWGVILFKRITTLKIVIVIIGVCGKLAHLLNKIWDL